jgi:hypothetical protein
MSSSIWGRSASKRRGGMTRLAARKIQDDAILLWLKRGYFDINSKLIEHRATISHTNFWKRVRNMLPPPPKKTSKIRKIIAS